MKKLVLFGAAFLMLAMVSCQKDYECVCTAKDSTTGEVSTLMTTKVTLHTTKSKAKSACSVATEMPGFTYTCAIQ